MYGVPPGDLYGVRHPADARFRPPGRPRSPSAQRGRHMTAAAPSQLADLTAERDALRRENDWFRAIIAEECGYDAPAGDAGNPLREILQRASRIEALAISNAKRADEAEARVARILPLYRNLMGHHRYVCACALASDEALSAVDMDSTGQGALAEYRALKEFYEARQCYDMEQNAANLHRLNQAEIAVEAARQPRRRA